ncbi:Pre-rRNA-processing protein ipi3 [Ceratobasidium sp. 392]|nr:Pre-rRNA-processing protein ipi3 [Ceratobasidium sp. 392]
MAVSISGRQAGTQYITRFIALPSPQQVASGIMLNSWEAHFRRVHALRFTNDDAALISASEDSAVSVWSIASLVDIQLQHELPASYSSGAILVYDIESLQLLRTIATHKDKGLSVIYLQCMLKPVDLQGHATINGGGASVKEPIPLRPVVPFQRMRDPKAREAHEPMVMILPGLKEVSPLSEPEDAEILAGQAYFLGAKTYQGIGAGQHVVNSRVTELETEVARLRADLGKAKGINDSMWDMVVDTILPKPEESAPNAEPEADFMVVDDAPTTKTGDGRKRTRK